MRGLLQGADGGRAYEEYQRSFRRDLVLEEKIRRVNTAIRGIHNLVILFTITTTNSPSPSHAANLAHLQGTLTDKKKELDDMVITDNQGD